ncbi:odorant receptor 82a [Glossina fuscipes fuscipes]
MIDLFERQRFCLRVMGHNFVRDRSQQSRRWHNTRCTYKYILCLFLVVSAQVPMINYTIYYIDHVELATASLSICFTNILTTVKIITFLLYKWEFAALMEELEEMYYEVRKAEIKVKLKRDNDYARNLTRMYWNSCCCTGLYFMTTPILKIIWSKLKGMDVSFELPMKRLRILLMLSCRFSFDFESTPGYQFCYIYTGLTTLVVIAYAVAIDGLFIGYTINLKAHFIALQSVIETNNFLKSERQLQRDLSSCVGYHNKILSLAFKLRDIYRPIIFAQFLMTSLQVCVIVYQMVTHINAQHIFLKNCLFLCSILLQLFIYCYGGEILKLESLRVGVSVQISHWYNLKPSHRRMLCLLMLRSQREAIIKAGFYEASLANFMAILKAAMSYITLIQSIE